LRHAANPFVAFDRHFLVFPTFFDSRQYCKVPIQNVRRIQGFYAQYKGMAGQSGLNFPNSTLKKQAMKRRTLLQASPLLFGLSGASQAQTAYPSKPIRYIVPVAAGGGSDMVGRALCERWAKVLGQSVVVDNIGGGGGVIASQNTARAAADGYTLMQGYVATHGTAPATRKLPYDAEKDFTPIGMIGSTPNVLCINTSLPPQNFKAFLEYVKQNPGRLSYGSAGAGSLTHLTAELFKLQTNSFMVHIPYRGIAPAITDLIGGQTQMMFPGLAAALPHIRSGRIRALAVTGTKRHPQVKDIPTLEESGLKGFDAQQWYGVVGPANMPAAIVKTLNDAMLNVLAQPDFKEKLSSEAVELMPMKPAEFAAYMKADLARWTQLAKARNIQLDS
jgi:tripartite-type tricarboxylate transporter receptor subunit TctC